MISSSTPGGRNFLTSRRSARARAEDAWFRILEKPASVILVRNGVALAAQMVRIEQSSSTSRGSEAVGAGASSDQSAVVFGVHGHPTLPDTDIQREDRFVWRGLQFRVMSLTYNTGEVQATAEVQV